MIVAPISTHSIANFAYSLGLKSCLSFSASTVGKSSKKPDVILVNPFAYAPNGLLKSAIICKSDGIVAIVSNIGRVLKLKINDETIPLMGKLAQGPMTMKMLPGELIVGAISGKKDSKINILMATKTGKFIRIEHEDLRHCKRGDLGQICLPTKEKRNNTKR